MYSASLTSGRSVDEPSRLDSVMNTFSVGLKFDAETDTTSGRRLSRRVSHYPLATGEGRR